MKLFELLAARFPNDSAAGIAAKLGISRQAYAQAIKRGRLSEDAALRAAALLDMDPGAALLANATGKNPAPPIIHTTPETPTSTSFCQSDNTNYANLCSPKKSGQSAPLENLHVITPQNRAEALDVVTWVFAVANIRADSPRFSYYVSRWNVPAKIATAKATGTFDAITARCPPISPDWLRYVPSALEECRRYDDEINAPRKTQASSCTPASARNLLTEKAA